MSTSSTRTFEARRAWTPPQPNKATVGHGAGKGGNQHAHQRNGYGRGYAKGLEEICGALYKRPDLGSQGSSGGPVAVLRSPSSLAGEYLAVLHQAETETGTTGDDDERGKESFSEHAAVTDEARIGFTF